MVEAAPRKTVLLVEDDEILAMAQGQAVESFGYHVIRAGSGEEALEIVRAAIPPDLILMDIDLGAGLDGAETAERILRLYPVPIVFLTAHAEREMVERVRGITRYGYVIKNSGDFVLQSSMEMAFELFEAHVRNAANLATLREHEEKLRRSNADLDATLAALPDLMFEVDREGLIYNYRAPSYADLFVGPDQFLGKPVQEVLPPPAAAAIRAGLAEAAQTGRHAGAEYSLPLASGNAWFELSIAAKGIFRRPDARFVVLARDITARKRAEALLQASEERFRMVSSCIADVAYSCVRRQGEMAIDWLAGAVAATLGYSEAELAALGCWGRIVVDDDFLHFQRHVLDLESGESGVCELRVRHKEGRIIWLASYARCQDDGGEHRLYGALLDITARKLAAEEIRRLLAEKELLLKEVHHRVKNHLSMATSLLTTQAERQETLAASAVLQDARGRLQSMGVLYDRLYRSENLSEMPLQDYLTPLVEELIAIFPNGGAIVPRFQMEDFPLEVKQLAALGIAVNELVTNALKHAFSGRTGGTITVAASQAAGRVTVTIADDGVGLPAEFKTSSSPGFGVQLVELLAHQLEGTLRFVREGGTRVVLEFPRTPWQA